MKTRKEILDTEYSERFDKLRQDSMENSYHKYGPLRDNAKNEAYNFLESLKMRVEAFEKTKNTDYLVDVANYCMMIFMYPEKEQAFHSHTSADESPGISGVSVKELEEHDEIFRRFPNGTKQ